MRFMQTESVLQTKNRSGPAKNRFSVALPITIASLISIKTCIVGTNYNSLTDLHKKHMLWVLIRITSKVR